LKENKDEGFSDIFEDELWDIDLMIATCFEEVIQSEMEWFEYLSGIQEIMGFNAETINDFLSYYTHIALKSIGNRYSDRYTSTQNELVLFYESKKNLNNSKALAQETNLLTYNIGVLEDGGFYDGDLTSTVSEIIEEFKNG
jgi:ribonucleotide reductase beta subunit family protein with ferritin-like domain